jgi:ATP-binding cassette subfamily B protein
MPSLIGASTRAIKLSGKKSPRIEFRNVTFVYPNSSRPTIKGISFVIEPGQKIAFVGPNGAGKTTVIKLLARFYDVTSGEILIDSHNIKELDIESWYNSLGVIFQDFLKYEYTLGENIHFGKIREPFDIGKIKKAAKLSGSDEIARDLNRGYNHMLGLTFEGGTELSLGQWQKVALGRAFLRDAPILVLDEPTSSIDASSEREIFDKVERCRKVK